MQVAVYQNGALIVDAAADTADPASGRPVTSGTLIFSFSTGKNVMATLAHLLVARGFLDYDSLVTVWGSNIGFCAAPLRWRMTGSGKLCGCVVAQLVCQHRDQASVGFGFPRR